MFYLKFKGWNVIKYVFLNEYNKESIVEFVEKGILI